jgi:hypothetical protein
MGNDYFLPVKSDAGIQRDGTVFDSTLHNGGSMVRFYRGRPQKIGGWQLISKGTSEIVRTLSGFDSDGFIFVYMGRASSVSFLQLFPTFITSSETIVTPTTGFIPDVNNNWIFDSVTYATDRDLPTLDRKTYVIASVAPNLSDIGSSVERPILYSELGSSTPFQTMIDSSTSAAVTTSGGVVVVGSFIVVYGQGGLFEWNDGADFTTWDPTQNFAQLGTAKYIYAETVRSGTSPAALFWSLNSVVIGTINQAGTGFNFAYVSTTATVLSPKCIVSLDPNFYWVGNNSFWMFNGSVQEWPNTVNKEWFFTNINPNERAKTYAYINTKWNEIWICFCKGTATEPNWSIVNSLTDGTWYDTDQIERSAALPGCSIFTYPIMTSSVPVRSGGNMLYPLYAHEVGTDAVAFGVTTPIVASIESQYFNLWVTQPAAKVNEIDYLIIDIRQTGQMYFYINYMGYPNSVIRRSENFTFLNVTEFLTINIKASIFSITFVSNVIDGNFTMGNTILHMNSTDDQRIGPTS